MRDNERKAYVMSDDMSESIVAALKFRQSNGWKHLHHRDCIHNLPPEEQVALRGYTVDKWLRIVGPLPKQITPDDWETRGWRGDE